MHTSRFKSIFHILIAFIILASLLASPFGVRPAHAATLIVTNLDDDDPGSLRATLASAGVGDTITFDSTLSGGTIYLASTLTLTQDVTIDGSALTTQITLSGDSDNNGTGDVGVFEVNTGVTVMLDSLTITKGKNGTVGAGIYNNGGMLTVTNSTLADNSATNGGGIYSVGGTLTITNSTISGNIATLGHGGGIYNLSTLTITNSTFSSNSGKFGGGIMNGGTLTVTNSTFSGNSAASNGGGIYNGGTLNYTNTIIANSTTGGDCVNIGTIVTNANNVVKDGSASCEALMGDPKLGPLANNGGPTKTFALLAGSYAFDFGTSAGCPSTDQRGVARPQNGACDIGAYEGVPPVITEGANVDVTMSEDSSPTPFSLTLHATHAEGDPLTWSIKSQSIYGSASAAPGPANSSVISYTPLPNYNGTDTFTVEVSDGSLTDTITVNVTVQPVSDHPSLIWNQSYRIQYDTWYGIEDVNAVNFAEDAKSLQPFASEDVNTLAFPSGYRLARSGTFTFKPNVKFTSFNWITYRGPNQGKAQVIVDGKVKATIDLYRRIAQWQYEVPISGLTNAKHTVIIKPLNSKRPASNDTWVVVDGFKIGSTTYNDNKINVSYNDLFSYGSWLGKVGNGPRFGAYRISNVKNATATFLFEGTEFKFVTARGKSYGKVGIYVDGILRKTVDLYSATQQWQYKVSVTGLSFANHEVVIKVLGTKNPASTGFGVVCDGFEIE